MTKRIIGIDFGTSTSVVRFKDYDDNGDPIGDFSFCDMVTFDGAPTIPTAIFQRDDGGYEFGNRALNCAARGKLFVNFKMKLISRDETELKYAQQLIELFFDHLYKTYEEQARVKLVVTEIITYVSYPAKWSPEIRKFMMNAAACAGFPNVEGRNEPEAALRTFVVHELPRMQTDRLIRPGDQKNILLIDMGAGTTDLVLCKVQFKSDSQDIEILCSWPMIDNPRLFGGKEVDEILIEHSKTQLRNLNAPADFVNSLGQYYDQYKKWKDGGISPSMKKNDVIEVIDPLYPFARFLPPGSTSTHIDRSKCENLLKLYLPAFPRMINECLDEANRRNPNCGDVDFVILTGGHSQWYFVKDIISGKLAISGCEPIRLPLVQNEQNKRILQMSCPQETVAVGLAYLGLPIKMKKIFTNNVWVKCSVCGHETEIVKIVSAGEILPSNKTYRFDNYRFDNLTFNVKIHSVEWDFQLNSNVYVGEQIETALSYSGMSSVSIGLWNVIGNFVDLKINGYANINVHVIGYKVEIDENELVTVTVNATIAGKPITCIIGG